MGKQAAGTCFCQAAWSMWKLTEAASLQLLKVLLFIGIPEFYRGKAGPEPEHLAE